MGAAEVFWLADVWSQPLSTPTCVAVSAAQVTGVSVAVV